MQHVKTKIIYHNVAPNKPCPDGLAAAWVAHKIYPDAELIGWEYGRDDIPQIDRFDRVIIVDFSFPKAILDAWSDLNCSIVVIDHHKSAQKFLENFAGGLLRFDMTKCGAILTWEFFFPGEPIPVFLKYINDQDMWEWKLPYSHVVREAFGVLGRSFELFDKLEALNQEQFLAFMLPIGQPLLKRREDKIKAIASRHFWGYIGEYLVPVVELRSDESWAASDVCSLLYCNYPQVPFSACFSEDKERKSIAFWHQRRLTWNLRSNKNGANFDVSLVAERFGGGGHRNAAGFSSGK